MSKSTLFHSWDSICPKVVQNLNMVIYRKYYFKHLSFKNLWNIAKKLWTFSWGGFSDASTSKYITRVMERRLLRVYVTRCDVQIHESSSLQVKMWEFPLHHHGSVTSHSSLNTSQVILGSLSTIHPWIPQRWSSPRKPICFLNIWKCALTRWDFMHLCTSSSPLNHLILQFVRV